MQRKIVVCALVPPFILLLTMAGWTEMVSDNFRIRTSVQSGGGAVAGSSRYQIQSTLGQPSPLLETDDMPFSDNFELYSGFWYTVADGGETCPGDLDGDKDVDGVDIELLIFSSSLDVLPDLAEYFGRTDCP